jgi:hypothetical protein
MKKAQPLNRARKQPRANDRYARLAMSSLNHCDRSIEQFRAISALVTTVVCNPAVTDDERQAEHTILSFLMATVEGYEREAEAYRELVADVAMDARNLPDARLSADEALRLMEAVELPERCKFRDARSSLARRIRSRGQPARRIHSPDRKRLSRSGHPRPLFS